MKAVETVPSDQPNILFLVSDQHGRIYHSSLVPGIPVTIRDIRFERQKCREIAMHPILYKSIPPAYIRAIHG